MKSFIDYLIEGPGLDRFKDIMGPDTKPIPSQFQAGSARAEEKFADSKEAEVKRFETRFKKQISLMSYSEFRQFTKLVQQLLQAQKER
jgi:hypothetical protein